MVRKLNANPVPADGDVPRGYLAIRDVGMHALGVGTTRGMRSIVRGLLMPSLSFPEYTLGEKINLWVGKARTGVSAQWGTMVTTRLDTTCTSVGVPVYFMHGIHDYTCSYLIARAYFNTLSAPAKGFYTFGESAHSPMFEEPEKFAATLRDDVLAGRVTLGD
jgi:pimeloyl-ACP methyl ester carboxylesterase